ncbi:hypothetical protein ILYODFUR_026582 [Ilyodon furcidens]|uniref:Uncharacterized protein n=1 Tax=Ilyodon furcidens TaxID=33524 RepID=A0ABV0TDT3_9TELE
MDSLQSFISSLLSSSGSPPPILPHQHFLRIDNVQLAPGSSHRHSALQRSSWLVSKGEMYHSILFLNCFLIHLLFKHAVFPTRRYIKVDHILLCILTSHSGTAPNPAGAAHSSIFSNILSPKVDHCFALPDGLILCLNYLLPTFLRIPFGGLSVAFKHFRDLFCSVI